MKSLGSIKKIRLRSTDRHRLPGSAQLLGRGGVVTNLAPSVLKAKGKRETEKLKDAHRQQDLIIQKMSQLLKEGPLPGTGSWRVIFLTVRQRVTQGMMPQ